MKRYIGLILLTLLSGLLLTSARSEKADAHACLASNSPYQAKTLTESVIAKELGWTQTGENRCGGYYLEAPFIYPQNENLIQISSNEGMLFSQRGTSVSQGRITITRANQQIIANKGYLYRDPATGKIVSIDLVDHVILREPNDLVLAQTAHYNWKTNSKLFNTILYRMAIYSNFQNKPTPPKREELKKTRQITQLSAWGQAKTFKQDQPKIYEFENASYSTCPPLNDVWQVKANDILLNQETGRGLAKNASILVKGVPVFYAPYINFPIDSRRQTGFLWPIVGTSSKSGAYFAAPFYWNLAPNYDTTITPTIMAKRGMQVSDSFRYLTPSSEGDFNIAILPNDKLFSNFQESTEGKFSSSTDPNVQAELRRLENASTTRKSFFWNDSTRFNDHWFGDVDYNYVSDDYYLRDLSNNLNEVTTNQLLQQAQINYKGQNWNFLGRVQGYQTLHPVDETLYQNQYTRLPQLILQGDYPDSFLGLDYFVNNDVSHFDIRNTPGSSAAYPMGNRINIQPGISRSFHLPYFYFVPRAQFAATQYDLGHVANSFPNNPSRSLPIFDISSGMYFDRDLNIFHNRFRQTLEPRIYYTYVPFRNQSQLPVFDTTINTLTYDQLFTYNRFSGLDRIGDANQLSVGVTTRFIDQQSGYEKIRVGVGQILYFKNRLVTLCNDIACTNVPLCTGASCTDNPNNPVNRYPRSPIAGVLNYNLNPDWSVAADIIWNSKTNNMDNQTLTVHYQPNGSQKIVNLGYSYVRQGDILLATDPYSGSNNLSQTDFSFSWPLVRDWSAVGRWTQNWNHRHMQNLLFGLQYDSCCWAVRFITGRAFVNLNPNNTAKYNNEFFLQFALKGLGNIGSRDPTQRLNSSISGYQSNFGQDF